MQHVDDDTQKGHSASKADMNRALVKSAGWHAFIVVFIALLSFVTPLKEKEKTLAKFKIVEKQQPVQKIAPKVKEKPIVIKKQNIPQEKKTQTPVKKSQPVFGASKKSITASQPTNVTVKAGNTVAKAPEGKKMDDEAPPLPAPTEEYLVNEMPTLESEVRIDYPPEARRRGVEGVVVMQILIDNEGRVRQASVLEGPGYGLNQAALEAIYEFKFKPAYVEKKPVAVQIKYAYRFVLER